MGRRPTLADVADRAGLSKTAVSLVLNNRPNSRLSTDAEQRVREAARELNYRPNPAARSLRIGKTRTVGFISDDVTVTRYASSMIRGLLDVAEAREHTVVIAETGSSTRRMQQALEVMLDRQADGIIFGLMAARQITIPQIPADVPVVMLNATSTQGHTAVLPAEYDAGYQNTRLLLDHGHQRIGLIGNSPPDGTFKPHESATLNERFAGIHAALAESAVEPLIKVRLPSWEPKAGYTSMHQILHSGADVTGIICLNDRLAFGAYQALHEANLKVPDDVSIVSFDDDDLASYLRPGLTTARLPYEEMGQKAMELVLSDTQEPHRHLVPMQLQQRGSVGSVPNSRVTRR